MTPQETASACVAQMLQADAASKGMNIEVVDVAPGRATARMTVTRAMTNGFDICHGGYLFAFGDSTLAFAANTYNDVTVLAAASIDCLRSAKLGTQLTAVATEQHRGRSSALYDVTITDADGRTIALMHGRCTPLGRALLPASAE